MVDALRASVYRYRSNTFFSSIACSYSCLIFNGWHRSAHTSPVSGKSTSTIRLTRVVTILICRLHPNMHGGGRPLTPYYRLHTTETDTPRTAILSTHLPTSVPIRRVHRVHSCFFSELWSFSLKLTLLCPSWQYRGVTNLHVVLMKGYIA